MPQNHTVAEGENMLDIAIKYDFAYWETIYYDAGNGELREKCPEPMELTKGATVVIPDKKTKLVPLATNKKHRVTVHKLRAHFRLVLEDADGPMVGKHYVLEIGGRSYEGRTGSDGLIEHDVPPTAKVGKLSVQLLDDDLNSLYTARVVVGAMPPIGEVKGVQARLAYLALYEGPIDGNLSDETNEAIKHFKIEHLHLANPTDEIDDRTRHALDGAVAAGGGHE